MSTAQLNTTRILQHLQAHQPLRGGWGDPGKEHPKAHYFRQLTEPDADGNVEVAALCGAFEATEAINQLAETDVMAPENCTTCRRLLLEHRKLI